MPRMSWLMPAALTAFGLVLLISQADGQDVLPREPITEAEPLPRPGGPSPMPPGTEPAPFPATEPAPGAPGAIRPPSHGAHVPPGALMAGSGHAEDVEVVYIKTPPPPGCQTYWFAYLPDLIPRCGCDEDCGECVMCRLRNASGPCETPWGYHHCAFEASGGGPGHGHSPAGHDEFAALKQRNLLPHDYYGGPVPPSHVEALKQQGILPGDFFAGMTTHHAADMMRRGLLPPGYRGGPVPGDYLEHLKRQGMLPPNFGSGDGRGRGGLDPCDYLAQLKRHGMLSSGYPNGVGVIDPGQYADQLRRQGLIGPHDLGHGGDPVAALKQRGWLPPDYQPGRPQIYPQQYLAALARGRHLPPQYQPGVTSAPRGMLSHHTLQQRMENFESLTLAASHQFPQFGAQSVAYETNPWYFDKRDGAVYAALGYGQPVAMPLAPTVHHTYNFGWGTPVSRLTPVWRNPDQLGR